MTTLNTFGFIPERKGWLHGITVVITSRLASYKGLGFRVYKNGIPTQQIFYITDGDNYQYGAVRVCNINIKPFLSADSTVGGVCYFEAGDRIIVVAEDPAFPPALEGAGAGLDGFSIANNIDDLRGWLFYRYGDLSMHQGSDPDRQVIPATGSGSGSGSEGPGPGSGGTGSGAGTGAGTPPAGSGSEIPPAGSGSGSEIIIIPPDGSSIGAGTGIELPTGSGSGSEIPQQW